MAAYEEGASIEIIDLLAELAAIIFEPPLPKTKTARLLGRGPTPRAA
jgi:hypothetical protein